MFIDKILDVDRSLISVQVVLFFAFFSHWRRALDSFISSINSKGNPLNEPAWSFPEDLEWLRYSLHESQWSYQLNQAVLKWSKVLAGDLLERTNYFKHMISPWLIPCSVIPGEPRTEPDWFPQVSAPTWKDPAKSWLRSGPGAGNMTCSYNPWYFDTLEIKATNIKYRLSDMSSCLDARFFWWKTYRPLRRPVLAPKITLKSCVNSSKRHNHKELWKANAAS